MVKAEIIENLPEPKEDETVKIDNVPNVNIAIEQWNAYQKLCKGLLNERDYQEIEVKEKDKSGNYITVKKKKTIQKEISMAKAIPCI